MKANPQFIGMPISFWAYVRAITESLGYSTRVPRGGDSVVKNPTVAEMFTALMNLERPTDILGSVNDPSEFALSLKSYFNYRADILNNVVRHDLMTAGEAQLAYEETKAATGARPTGIKIVSPSTGNESAVEFVVGESTVRVPLNKQSGDKKVEAYLTGIVNLLVAHGLAGLPCDYDPRKIPTVDHDGLLFQTFSRRYDGSFPSTKNPIAMWEIKEYYFTTTFGSKISDAVYITSLDGYERIELERETGLKIQHLVMVDAYGTWWGKGRSYLCRMIDVLHMGHVDEILFGREVIRELPQIVAEWVTLYQNDSETPIL